MIHEQIEKDLELLKVDSIEKDGKGNLITARYPATERQVRRMLSDDYEIEAALEDAKDETWFRIRPTKPL